MNHKKLLAACFFRELRRNTDKYASDPNQLVIYVYDTHFRIYLTWFVEIFLQV